MPVYLLPLVVRFLTDSNNQVDLVSWMFVLFPRSNIWQRTINTLLKVRKTSQAALLVLLEQGLADTRDVEDQVLILSQVHFISRFMERSAL